MTRHLLIASGAYVEPELEAEFGRLPPAFLPIGNRRLFVHQAALVRPAADRILLSLPEDFTPDPVDAALLAALGIETVSIPAGLSLGQSIVYAMNMTAASGHPFRLLHGDTLLRDIDLDVDDAVSVEQEALPGYRWGYVPEGGTQGRVLTGYFAFAESARFVQEVTRAGGAFVPAVLAYAAARPLRHLVAGAWLDCGHVTTYHRSRRSLTTERAFNHLSPSGRSVIKTSRDAGKIAAEAAWFEALPPPLRVHTPAYLGRGNGPAPSYALEYLHLPTLADLFVFGRLEAPTWARIFDGCDEFLSACAAHPGPVALGADLFLGKTLDRLEAYARATGTDLDAPCRFDGRALPGLRAMAETAAAAIPPAGPPSLIHGDFCFSNILYDARADLIRVIDPRGRDPSGAVTPYGDQRYDIGKLHHSAVGCYDLILAGYYRLDRHGPLDLALTLPQDTARTTVGALFMDHLFAGQAPAAAAAGAISVLLFLSMLPLHADDPQRQAALLANGMRLFGAL